MAEKPSEMSPMVAAFARALIPPPPGDAEKKEVYEQAGRAVIGLSNAENLLALVFCILSVPVPIEEAKAMFASQFGLERKLKLINFMVMHANYPKETELWNSICKELTAHSGVRNLIAHQRMMVSYNGDIPEVDVLLAPLFYSKKGKGKVLRLADIKATADELEKVNVKLWKLVRRLGKPK